MMTLDCRPVPPKCNGCGTPPVAAMVVYIRSIGPRSTDTVARTGNMYGQLSVATTAGRTGSMVSVIRDWPLVAFPVPPDEPPPDEPPRDAPDGAALVGSPGAPDASGTADAAMAPTFPAPAARFAPHPDTARQPTMPIAMARRTRIFPADDRRMRTSSTWRGQSPVRVLADPCRPPSMSE